MKIYKITKLEDAASLVSILKAQEDNLKGAEWIRQLRELREKGETVRIDLRLRISRDTQLIRIEPGKTYKETNMGAVWASGARELAAARGWTPEYTG